MNRFLTRFVLPAVITFAAVGGAIVLVRSAESAEREPATVPPPLVEHVEAKASPRHPRLSGNGVVEPAREATLSPQLSGRVVYVSPSLVVGGRVEEGQVLLRLDKRDYEIALRQQRATVQQRKVELELEDAYGKVAKREWELMGNPNADGRLAKREPQKEAAEVAVDAARSQLERAKLDLQRTVLEAPFNATVKAESVEIGEIASPGAVVATLVGTDALWVRVSIPVEYLALLDVPGLGAQQGAVATVTQRLGPHTAVQRAGRVIRLVNEVDAESRTAQVLVEVERPLDPPPGELPLLPGAFVEVELQGRELPQVFALPRVAVFEGRRAWVVDDEQRLRKRELRVVWGDDERVYATHGLADGDRVVVTPPATALEGMEVRSEVQASSSTDGERVSAAAPADAPVEETSADPTRSPTSASSIPGPSNSQPKGAEG
ncbi:efflux RND transporter periplasmic adaptor subunit [Paraliomyxa miuraensis]|uniref:efflux RND transporter periplasmic adaptor subunit n=1 Tax=Paraliomyxa miuraensis TaxID=376150 RepID=UPI0022553139|nr:efflux RND transporter periplasmic adaptor subunit [Paraliomyxa miuraensis]MCX4247908.1 efflux RND transporter periplasmic adaptor subunit [Paraliomyxa miuraensis]